MKLKTFLKTCGARSGARKRPPGIFGLVLLVLYHRAWGSRQITAVTKGSTVAWRVRRPKRHSTTGRQRIITLSGRHFHIRTSDPDFNLSMGAAGSQTRDVAKCVLVTGIPQGACIHAFNGVTGKLSKNLPTSRVSVFGKNVAVNETRQMQYFQFVVSRDC